MTDPMNSGTSALTYTFSEGGDDENRIPPGEYVARLINVKSDVSKAGNPMWVWDAKVAEGTHKGFRLRMWTVMTKDAEWKAKKVAKALELYDSETRQVDLSDARGRRFIAVVQDDEYNGEVRSRLQDVKKHPDGSQFDTDESGLP